MCSPFFYYNFNQCALDKFKYKVVNERGVPLTDGYNGDLTHVCWSYYFDRGT
ncbi:small, acid-soluble spore protein, alpha/beta type [Extibacter muris]|uniref:Small, acid-soluble spore protein, alpha/beta type n=1 Tax=Extibacter muris TaxID=1796622 RepID=A0A4R4FFP2_9FIRM|nr:small, acid-soluble spore protein, alpha/beta type [Extibacter muris]